MTLKEVAHETGFSLLFLREWIAQTPDHPFGICVKMPGSKVRTFKINEGAYRRWKAGERR
jgi:hypothetical protein